MSAAQNSDVTLRSVLLRADAISKFSKQCICKKVQLWRVYLSQLAYFVEQSVAQQER